DQALFNRVRRCTSYSCTIAAAYAPVSPCSSASHVARSVCRMNDGPDSRRWNHSLRSLPVTRGTRAMRVLCISGEWIKDKGHLHAETRLLSRACTTGGSLARPERDLFVIRTGT